MSDLLSAAFTAGTPIVVNGGTPGETAYALVDANNRVVSVTMWDATAQPAWAPPPGLTAIACDPSVSSGYIYSPLAQTFAPDITPAKLPRTLSAYAFMTLFTKLEQTAIVQATMTTATTKLAYDLLLAGSSINRDDPNTIQAMATFVSALLITQARADAILAA